MPDLPASMVEAAARALATADDAGAVEYPDADDEYDCERYRDMIVRDVLATTLAACEVREQWGSRIWIDGGEDSAEIMWAADRAAAEAVVDLHAARRAANPPDTPEYAMARRWMGNARLLRRLVITTPAEEVATEEVPAP